MARNVIPVRLVIRAVVYKHVGVRSKITLGIIFLPREKLKGNRNIGGLIVRLSTIIFFILERNVKISFKTHFLKHNLYLKELMIYNLVSLRIFFTKKENS